MMPGKDSRVFAGRERPSNADSYLEPEDGGESC